MRCLVIADLHYSLPQFDWLLSAAPQFDLVILAGDALDIGSRVDFRAQIVVVKKYLAQLAGTTRVILCSGNHDLDQRSPEGEKISRWIGEARELGIACDGDSLTVGDTAVHGMSLVGRTAGQAGDRQPASRGRRAAAGAMDLGPSRAGGEFADELGRQAFLRRRRTRAMDRKLPAFHGDLGSCASIALHPRRLMVRSTWRYLGVQRRPSGRPPARPYRTRYRRGSGILARGRRRAIYRTQRAVAAAGRTGRRAGGVAHILGSDCRSEPGETFIGGRLIMLCRISPTIAR